MERFEKIIVASVSFDGLVVPLASFLPGDGTGDLCTVFASPIQATFRAGGWVV